MIKQHITLLVTLCAILVFEAGCGTIRTKPQAGGAGIVGKNLVKTTRSWDGTPLPAYPAGQPEVTIRRIIIPAGARLETHSHPVINAGILVSGELKVVSADGKTLRSESRRSDCRAGEQAALWDQ